jgi:hypothetical protein
LSLLLATTFAFAASGARATDANAADPPQRLKDGIVQIGTRSVRLPAGDWYLVQVKDFHGERRLRDIDVTTAWMVLLRNGQFGVAMQLSLPVADMKKERRVGDNPCTARDGVLRGDYSHSRSEMECLAVFGHHDLQHILEQRGTRTAAWLARKGVARVDDGVEFTYSHREGAAFGRVAFYFPARDFASDDDAAKWAQAVRETFEPLVERRVAEVRLPALPQAVPDEPPARP